MITEEIRERLFALQDLSYRDFQKILIPGVAEDAMIGVRTPDLKKLAKEYGGKAETEEVLRDTPHRYFDENQLHALSDHTYTVRFGVGMLMQHFLKEDFDTALAGRVADLRSEEYYVNMMRAWYFATALAGQYEAVLPFIENRKLDPWTHNRAIQKACESFRVSPERKAYLKSLKIPGEKKRGGKKPAGKGK